MDNQRYDDTIAGFYRAARGTKNWVAALEPLRELLGVRYVQLSGVDPHNGAMSFSVEAGHPDPAMMRDYYLHWQPRSPRTAVIARLPEGGWMHCDEHFDEDFVAKDPFYQGFALPAGSRWCSASVLVAEPRMRIVLALMRGEDQRPLDAGEKALAARLARHLADAMRLWNDVVSDAGQQSVGTMVLDALRAPLVLIDPQRRVRMANPGARALLEQDDGLRIYGGALMASVDSDDRRLLQALRALNLGEDDPVEEDPARDRVFLRITRGLGRSALAVCVCALRPHGRGDTPSTPMALVLLHDPDLTALPDPSFLAASYNFTPAEAKVTLALARGIKPKAIAHEHGVALSTVRSQLKSAMAKAGVRSQADLVSRLAALPMGALVEA